MAYEISEGAAAAALLLPTSELDKLEGATEFAYNYLPTAMGLIYDNLDNVVMSDNELKQYKEWFDPTNAMEDIVINEKGKDARLTAVLHGYSAARGIKAWFRSSQSGEGSNDKVADNNVFVTGAGWDGKISFLKMRVGDWDDYNSSDLVVIKGHCYYGISLKKKKKKSSADPPMINKSVKAILEELGQDKMASDFYDARSRFFGGKVREQTLNGGALAGSTINGMTNTDLFQTTIKNQAKSSPDWVNLMDLKGRGMLELNGKKQYDWTANNKGSFIIDLKTGKAIEAKTIKEYKKNPAVRELFGYDRKTGAKKESAWTMRKNINSKMANANPLYKRIQKIVDDEKLATDVGKALVKAVMKTQMQEEFNTKAKKYLAADGKPRHFGFALVTALGEVKGGKITAAAITASFKSDPTMQQTIANLSGALKEKNYKITLDTVKTNKAKAKSEPPAKLFFVVGIDVQGKQVDLLQMEVRYKGSFSPSPQFLGGVTKTFMKKLNETDVKEQYKFEKACNK